MLRALFLFVCLCVLAPLAQAQDILKIIDGSEKQVKVIEVTGDKVIFYELGDPLTLEHDMPRSRVSKIVHEDGVVENLRHDPPKQGLVIVRKAKPDSTKEAIVLKTQEEIPAKILAVESQDVVYRHRGGPKAGYQDGVRRDAVAKLRYADGSERNLEKEAAETVRATGRKLFDFEDQAGPDVFFRQHVLTKAAHSQGRLYTPAELLSFKAFNDLKKAVDDKTDVRFLDLHGQNLSAVPPAVLSLKRLVGIDLSNNPLKAFPDELLTMPGLQYVWVDSCQLAELKPKFDNKQPSNLIYLSACGNQIAELNPALAELPSLYVLRMTGNHITRVRGKAFFTSAPGKNSTLAAIDLSNNGMEAVPAGLGTFPQMRYLRCRQNKLADASGREGDLTHLTDLDLSFNPISTLDPSLFSLPRLEQLYFDGPPTSAGLTVKLPAALSDSLSFIDVAGLASSATLALILKTRKPGLRVRYYSGLLGKAEESEPGTPPHLAGLLDAARKGDVNKTRELAQLLTQRGDYGLALAALASATKDGELAPEGPLRKEQDDLKAAAAKR